MVGAFTAAGLVQAIVFLARRHGLRRRLLTPVRIVGFLSLIPLATGAGAVLFPVIVFGALAFGQTPFGAQRDGWQTPRWLFYPALVLIVASMLISVPLLVGQSG